MEARARTISSETVVGFTYDLVRNASPGGRTFWSLGRAWRWVQGAGYFDKKAGRPVRTHAIILDLFQRNPRRRTW